MKLLAAFGGLQNVLGQLTFQNVFLAMAIAAVVTFIAIKIWGVLKFAFKYPAELPFSPVNLKQVVERCCLLFPMETIIFRGQSFRRGMKVKITTISKKTFEGQLIGINADNVLCIIAKGIIAADILEHIIDIALITEAHDI